MARERKNEAIWLESEGRWLCAVQIDGKRKKFYSSQRGRKGKIACEKKVDEWLERTTYNENARLQIIFDDFITMMKEQDMDYSQFQSIGKSHILPLLGNKRMETLTEYDFQSVLDKAYKKGLSKKSLQNIRGCCTSFLKYCRRRGVTKLRPELVVNRKAPKSQKRALENDEIHTVFSCDDTVFRGKVQPDWFRYMYRFAVTTGLRPGELCALMISDISDGYLHVCRSNSAHNGLTDGKNENANRKFKLNDAALKIYESQLGMLRENEYEGEWLFPNRDGTLTSEETYYRNFRRYCAYNGISDITPYELRHTYVSINKDMPEDLLKLQVGHAKTMPTRDQYSHERYGDAERAAELSSTAFGKILPNTK